MTIENQQGYVYAHQLSEKLWYRLLNVLYFGSYALLGLGFLFIAGWAILGENIRPHQVENTEKNYISCTYGDNKGKSYLIEPSIVQYYYGQSFDSKEDLVAKKLCLNNSLSQEQVDSFTQKALSEGFTHQQIQVEIARKQTELADSAKYVTGEIYTIHEVMETRGSWKDVSYWVAGAGVVVFVLGIIIEIIRGIILYVFVGKKVVGQTNILMSFLRLFAS